MCLPGRQVPFCRLVAKSLKESIALSWSHLGSPYVPLAGVLNQASLTKLLIRAALTNTSLPERTQPDHFAQ